MARHHLLTCFLGGLGLLAATETSTTDVQREMDPTIVDQHHFRDCGCRNPVVSLVTAGSLRCLSGLVLDRTSWQPRAGRCPVTTVEQRTHLPPKASLTSLPTAQKRAPEKEGESRTPSTYPFVIPVFPFGFVIPIFPFPSLFCSRGEVRCLHLKRGDTLIFMDAFQPEIFPDYTILVHHTILFPMTPPLLSPECNYLLSLISPHNPSITPNTLKPHSADTEDLASIGASQPIILLLN